MKTLRVFASLLAALLLFSSAVLAGEHLVNVDKNGLALQGYDPVAFFTEGKPVKGSSEFTYAHKGGVYHFASEANQKLFAENPDKYEPQFGGYCAYGVSKGGLYSIDVDAFQVYEGKLLLQYSAGARDEFNKDREKSYEKALSNWPKLVAENAKKN